VRWRAWATHDVDDDDDDDDDGDSESGEPGLVL